VPSFVLILATVVAVSSVFIDMRTKAVLQDDIKAKALVIVPTVSKSKSTRYRRARSSIPRISPPLVRTGGSYSS
jgi:hypothetical protein